MFDFDELDKGAGGDGDSPSFVAPPEPVPVSRRPRVLCLHGTAGSSGVLKAQLAVFAASAAAELDLVFVDGPLVCREDCPIVGKQVKLVRQFFPDEALTQWAVPGEDANGWRTYSDLQCAIDFVQAALDREAPIDAILGFSQGASMASVVAARAAWGAGSPLHCVVHMCPPLPGWTRQMPDLFTLPLPVPALIVQGEQDTVATGGSMVAALYESNMATVVTHADAHRPLPAKPKEAKELAGIIRDFVVTNCRDRKPV